MRYREPLSIAIALDRDAATPLHHQIAGEVASAVTRGTLVRGARMPSTRTLASLLGVSRGVTVAAYAELFSRGYLDSHHGSGTYVAGTPHKPNVVRPRPRVALDLSPGQLCREAFPLAEWRAAWRRASFHPAPASPPPLGLDELRQAIAEHLVRTRGLDLTGREIVVTGGTADGLRLVLDGLGLRGSDVALPEPIAPALRRAVRGDPMPVRDPSCRALVVSPPPWDAVLPAAHQRAAVAWAGRTGGWLVEVACDTVFHADARAPRLHESTDAVVMVGGFCDLLTPALALGYAVVPSGLVDIVGDSPRPPHVTQLAMASLLRDGTVVRRMHRLGQLYDSKRQVVETVLAGLPVSLGLGTALVRLPDEVDAVGVARSLRERGLRVGTLADYYSSAQSAPPALVLGYGHLPEPALRQGMTALVDALTRLV